METADEQKEFHNFLDFPLEIRMEIIDKMSTGDRIMFSKSAKLCNKEAKASKNFLYELIFYAPFNEMATIFVLYTDVRPQEEKDKFTTFKFIPRNFDKYFLQQEMYHLWVYEKYEETTQEFLRFYEWFGYFLRFYYHHKDFFTRVRPVEVEESLWKGEVDKQEDVMPFATSKFKELLKTYQHTVKRLVLKGWPLEDEDLGIHHFRCLEVLIFHTETNYEHFLSKVRTPLKVLKIKGSNFEDNFTDMKQIYQVKDRLIVPFARFTREQFFRISAISFHIHIGNLTENDVFDFIESWQHDKLLRLLGIKFPNPNGQKITIKHKYEIRRFAEFECKPLELKFDEICDEPNLEHENNVDSGSMKA